MQKEKKAIQAFINFGIEVNKITPIYAFNLAVKMQKIDVDAQKIDSSLLRALKMVIASFYVIDKFGRA